jgi:predicted nucleotide-binding protein
MRGWNRTVLVSPPHRLQVRKHKQYPNTKFDSKVLSAAVKRIESLTSTKLRYGSLEVELKEATWSFDTPEEFLAASDQGLIHFSVASADGKVNLRASEGIFHTTTVAVEAPARDQIESVFSVFDNNAERSRLPEQKKPNQAKVFIGHGGDPQWRDLKDHLHEKHGYAVEAYEIGSRAGHTIRDILEEMLETSSFALLVMTGEDESKDGKIRARQNVVHEAGLFQGKLGFSRAIILLEDGTEEFSNIHGLQQIRFSKGKIKESFGDVLAVLKREFG